MKTIAVVGASLAGLSAARALRAQEFSGELVMVGEEIHRPYDRPPLSKDFLAGRLEADDLALESEDDKLDAQWLLGVRATSLDAETRTLTLSNGSRLVADGIVLATGSRARTLPGTESVAGVHTLRSLDDAIALRRELVPGRRLVVIGAGFIGAEAASTAHALGLDVTVIEAMATPFADTLGVEMGTVVSQLHADHGVHLVCGIGVHRLVGQDRVEGVELADGRLLPADVVLVGIGAIANIEWLQGSGLALGNGVLCEAGGLTNQPGIVAVGDCAAWLDRSSAQWHRVEHWTGAFERPKLAVACLLSGTSAGSAPRPPYFWSDQYDARIQFAGTTRRGDVVTVEAGDPADRSFLAAYRRDGELVAVLGVNQVRQFTRWRRQLSASASASAPIVAADGMVRAAPPPPAPPPLPLSAQTVSSGRRSEMIPNDP